MDVRQQTFHPVLQVSGKATGPMLPHRFVDIDGHVCLALKKPFGVTLSPAAKDEPLTIGILGLFPVLAAAEIEKGKPVGSDSQGRAIAIPDGNVSPLNLAGFACNEAEPGEMVIVRMV